MSVMVRTAVSTVVLNMDRHLLIYEFRFSHLHLLMTFQM